MSKNKNYIIQIIPSQSGKTRSVIVSSIVLKLFLVLTFLFVICMFFFGFRSYQMAEKLQQSNYLMAKNSTLLKENKEFKTASKKLDSIQQTQKILLNLTQAFLDEDPSVFSEELTSDSLNHLKLDEIIKNKELHLKKRVESGISRPSIKPLIGIISRSFNDTIPEDGTLHKGVDIAGLLKDPVYATAPGKVIFSGVREFTGITIEIDHGDQLISLYGHLHSANVKTNQSVLRGEIIGNVGVTGNTTGPHLHYEVIENGIQQNPENFF